MNEIKIESLPFTQGMPAGKIGIVSPKEAVRKLFSKENALN